jgi:hypothetical protein
MIDVYVGMGYSDIPSVSILSNIATIFSKHMARRLGLVIIINASFFVTLLYNLVSIYLSDVTKRKFLFLTGGIESEEVKKALCK